MTAKHKMENDAEKIPPAAENAEPTAASCPSAADADGAADANPAESAAPVDASALAEEIEVLRDKFLRLQADFDNYRKRAARDEAARARRATEQLLQELLPVLDHFELGLAALAEAKIAQPLYDGMALVQTQFLNVLQRAGVTPVESVGMPFDPHCHECVAHCPSDRYAENVVIQETRRGYRLGDYLLRPAQVIVSSGPGCSPAATDDSPPAVGDSRAESAPPMNESGK